MGCIYVAILIWWIVWLWRDEPGQASSQEAGSLPETKESTIDAGPATTVAETHEAE